MRLRAQLPAKSGRLLSVVGLLVTLLAATFADRAQAGSDFGLGLPRERQPRWRMRELLGPDRWRRLEAARFAIDLHGLDFTPDLSDDPARQEEVADVLLKSLFKVSQRALVRRSRLLERRDAVRLRLRGGERRRGGSDGIRVSPGVRIDHRPWLGAKLRLRDGGSPFWSKASLRVGSEFDGRNPSLKLAFQDRLAHGYLTYHSDRDRRGEAVELLVGFSF